MTTINYTSFKHSFRDLNYRGFIFLSANAHRPFQVLNKSTLISSACNPIACRDIELRANFLQIRWISKRIFTYIVS